MLTRFSLLIAIICITPLRSSFELLAQPSPNISAQSLGFKQSLTIPADTFSSPPKIFNLLQFTGTPDHWQEVPIELKRELAPSDRPVAQAFNARLREEPSIPSINFPPVGWSYQGKLYSAKALISEVWIIWMVDISGELQESQSTYYQKIFQNLKDTLEPDDRLFLVQGGDAPIILERGVKVGSWSPQDWKKHLHPMPSPQSTDQVTSTSRGGKRRQSLSKVKGKRSKGSKNSRSPQPAPLIATTSALIGLWYILYDELRSPHRNAKDVTSKTLRGRDLSDETQEAALRCGQPCELLIPHVKLLILSDEIKVDSSLKGQVQDRIQYNGHPLYGLHILQVTADIKRDVPKEIKVLRLNRERPFIITDRDLKAEISSLKRERRGLYYLLPMTEIHSYYWDRGSLNWEARSSGIEENFVGEVQLKGVPKETQKHLPTFQDYQEEYTRKLEREIEVFKALPRRSINFMITIGSLWAFLGLCLLFFILKVWRKKDMSEDEETQPISPKSPRVSIPAPVNPSIDPHDPTTRPAPAARSHHQENLDGLPPPLYIPSTDNSNPVHSDENWFDSLESEDPKLEERYEKRPPLEDRARSEDKPLIDDHDDRRFEPPPTLKPISTEAQSPSAHSRRRKGWRPFENIKDHPLQGSIGALYAESGPMRSRFFLIRSQDGEVGRARSCECTLPPAGELADIRISRRHCRLTLQNDGYWQIICISANGLFINRDLVAQGERHKVEYGDLIRMGNSLFRFKYGQRWHQEVT
jgi:hypothetical protein